MFFYFSSFIFNDNHVLIEDDSPPENFVIVREKLDGIDIDE